MKTPPLLVASALAALSLGSLALSPRTAGAEVNNFNCVPSAAHPRPVVLIHGRGGNVHGLGTIAGTLETAGYCVFGPNYGQPQGQGPYGMDHLDVSGAQVKGFIESVLSATGASQVDVVSHSAGTGVIDNIILGKNGASLVHRVVSYGGLHHPYAHAGVAEFADGTLFLPNLIVTARKVVPGIRAQDVIVNAINLYAGLGGNLAGIDVETATSNFADDLFNPDYWNALHGTLSEPDGTGITFGASKRSLTTNDSHPAICYTNIVGIADVVTGAAAGFQDEAPNVDNFVLLTPADHSQILDDAIAIGKMMLALGKPCDPLLGDGNNADGEGPGDDEDGSNDDDDDGAGSGSGNGDSNMTGISGGCSSAGGQGVPALAGLLLALLVFVTLRRHRSL